MSIITAGIDEVGLGAVAGPIISAVAVFRPSDLALLPSGVTDSKKVTEARRAMLYPVLCKTAFDVGIGWAWPWEIDEMGVRPALLLSYSRAMGELVTVPDLLYVDGEFSVSTWRGQQRVEPKADLKYREVSAASIIAKFFRDEIMIGYDRRHPQYNWKKNKGYESSDHAAAIRAHGVLIDPQDRSRYYHRLRYCTKFC